MKNKPLRLVSASRLNASDFARKSLLGQCLGALQWDPLVQCSVACGNDGDEAHGLAEIYNRFLTKRHAGEIVCFVHDDVTIDDYFLRQRLEDALEVFDVVGVAGNIDAADDDVSWGFEFRDEKEDELYGIDHGKFSGSVAHLHEDGERYISYFGPAPHDCHRLDGVFIAVNVERVLEAGVRFDERFRFHAYDVDFSRACLEAGLRVGTWPIAITHGSRGNFQSPAWREAALRYREKWSGSG